MSPFTLLFGRLVEYLGVELAANLVREFAGQTIQFPITDHYKEIRNQTNDVDAYGFSFEAALIGVHSAHPSTNRKAQPSLIELDQLEDPASSAYVELLRNAVHLLARSPLSPRLRAKQPEPIRSFVPSTIESLTPDRPDS